jgi:prepilin peptidase CpaA
VIIPLIFLSAFPASLLIAAMNDLYEYKIPNWVSVVLFASYFAASIGLGSTPAEMLEGFLLGCAALAIGFALFAGKFLGGGDAKLLAACAPWVGLSALAPFLLYTAFAGGALALAFIMFRKLPALPVYAHAPWLMRLHQRPKDIPYAVAIAAGGLLSFSQTPLFQLAFGG